MTRMVRLPGSAAHEWAWQLRGSCRDHDSAIFFHPDGERGGTRRRRTLEAKKICQSCPVIEQCRAFALQCHEPYGIWGGLSEEERHEMLSFRR